MKIDKSWYIKPDGYLLEKLAAGGVVVRKENSGILIGLIKDKKYKGYMLPKGGIEEGESAGDAAKREVSEETGINNLDLICFLGKRERLSLQRDKWHITSYYLFETGQISGVQKLEEGEEDLVFGWFDINNLPQLFWPEQKELIIENLEKIRKSI